MKKAISVAVTTAAVTGAAIFASLKFGPESGSTTFSSTLPILDRQAEEKRLHDAFDKSKISSPSATDFASFCKEGYAAACVESARAELVTCQEKKTDEACKVASTLLMRTCEQGFIQSCDSIFQVNELIPQREEARGHLERFCDLQVAGSCLTFEMSLRNQLDLDRLATDVDKAKWTKIRNRYISISDENCDKGHYFSCLSLLDEDASTADPKRIESAEKRLTAICDKAQEQFEKEDCLFFAEYLAMTGRVPEGQRYADAACATESEVGCLSSARISFSQKGGEQKGLTNLKRSCELGRDTWYAQARGYCDALESAASEGVSSWAEISRKPANSEAGEERTFAEFMKIQPRQPY